MLVLRCSLQRSILLVSRDSVGKVGEWLPSAERAFVSPFIAVTSKYGKASDHFVRRLPSIMFMVYLVVRLGGNHANQTGD